MKRWIVLLVAIVLMGSAAAFADPIHIGGGPMLMSQPPQAQGPMRASVCSPIHIGGGPTLLSSPIHIGGGPFAY